MSTSSQAPEEIQMCKTLLLSLLKQWHHYHTAVFQKLSFNYEKLFSNLASDIERKQLELDMLSQKNNYLQSKRNVGERITPEVLTFIDTLISKDAAREKKHPHHEYRYNGASIGFELIDGKLNLSDDDNDMQTLYRQLVKRLHPDVVESKAEYRAYWDLVQMAYKQKDIDRILMLYVSLCPTDVTKEKLNALITKQKRDLSALQTEEPFCYEGKLEDINWINEHRRKLQNRLSEINRNHLQISRQMKTFFG
jgi:hypothetical protein